MTEQVKDQTVSNPVEAVVILRDIINAKPNISPFRSGGFLNKDYDMARIYIDMPIIKAKKLISKLKAI